MRTRRPPRPRAPYTFHSLSIGETRKVRQRGMLSKTLQERDDQVQKKKKPGITRKEIKWVKESKKTQRYEKKLEAQEER